MKSEASSHLFKTAAAAVVVAVVGVAVVVAVGVGVAVVVVVVASSFDKKVELNGTRKTFLAIIAQTYFFGVGLMFVRHEKDLIRSSVDQT